MILSILMAANLMTADVHFQRHDVASYPSPYQVAVADVDGDGKADILALSTEGNCVDWFENPTWRQHPIARTHRNIDLAPMASPWDKKKLGIALASGFHFADGNRGGQIQWLSMEPPDQTWRAFPIAVDPVVHRVRWGDLDGDGRSELIHAPIFGPGSKGPSQVRPSHLWAFRPPRTPDGVWERWVIDETLTVLHAIHIADLDGDGRCEILTGSFEGIHRFDWKDSRWQKTRIAAGGPSVSGAPGAARGTSEIVPVHLGAKPMRLAAVEPWHGHQLVVYAPGSGTWTRHVLDESLQEGHVLVAADFDGDGQDEIIVGWRAGGGGLRLFHLDADGVSWRSVEIERGIAVEGAVVVDLNGDGRLDLVVAAGRNHKIAWYENLGVKK